MLEYLFGSANRARVLTYVYARKQAYATEISKYYKCKLTPIQHQLNKLEEFSILYSKNIGRTRVFLLNPRYAYYNEICLILSKSIEFLSDEERNKLINERKRPHRNKKPL